MTGPKAPRSSASEQVLEAQIHAAVRRAAARLHLLGDRVGGEVAGENILAVLGGAVARGELVPVAIEQPAAQLVAERIPHDRVHADQARREVPDGEELHELHVDEAGARAQRQRVPVAAHVGGCTVAAVEARQAAGGNDGRLCRDAHQVAGGHVKCDRTRNLAVDDNEIDDAKIAGLADAGDPVDGRAQRLGDGGARIEEVHIDTARPVMARRVRLHDAPVAARPADAPRVHLADTLGAFLAEQPGQRLVAEAAPGGEGIVEVMAPVVVGLRAQRHRNGHLRHDRCAAAPDQAAIGQQHAATGARGLDGGIHAGGSGADDEHVRLGVQGLFGSVHGGRMRRPIARSQCGACALKRKRLTRCVRTGMEPLRRRFH